MGFVDKLADEVLRSDLGYTDNGALAYNTTGNALTDFNFNISSMRQKSKEEIMEEFKAAYAENEELAIRYIFFAGDIREGLGERHVFKSLITDLAKNDKEMGRAVLSLIPEYGRWDEVLCLLNTPLKKDAIALIKSQLDEDIANAKENKPVSLCAKWMPSLNATNKQSRKYALKLCEGLGLEKGDYRHMLAALRDRLNIIEKALSEKDIEKLERMQESLTSKQNYKYKKALMNLMPEQRMEYFKKVLAGEANYNADVLEPHEIYYRYEKERCTDPDMGYEIMWSMLPNKVKPDNEVLVVRDGSGSMTWGYLKDSNCTPLDVASALSVYFSEHTKGEFKDKFITFSSKPQLVDLSDCENLNQKIKKLRKYNDCSNTNLEATFDLILNTAVKNEMSQDEMPKSVLIISDMQFDAASSGRWNETLFDTIRNKFEEAGYKIPQLIFWNANLEKSVIPEVKNELGLVLLGGYSKNNVDMICNNDFTQEIINDKGEVEVVTLTPAQILANKIMSERYDAVGKAIKPILDVRNKSFKVSNEER